MRARRLVDNASMTMPGSGKIVTHQELLARRKAARQAGRTVVQCHGCFDIVHPGHIRHLRFAKSQGDILLVSITGDASIDKGAHRPLIPQELRAENLAELDCVDWVYIEPRPTAAELLDETRPDVYIKGREYEFNRDPRFAAERETVERHGGRVVFSSGDVVFSSTALIEAMEHSSDPFQKRLSQLARHEELDHRQLQALIESFRGRRVVVIGEIIQDTYVFCDRPEVADEAAMMTLRPVRHQYFDGGAAIIARHLAALGAKPVLITAMPESELAGAVRRRLESGGIELRTMPARTSLAERQRMIVGSSKMLKLDLVEPIVLDAGQRDALIDTVTTTVRESAGADAAIIADFGLGLFSPAITHALCRAIRPDVGVLTGAARDRRSNLRSMHAMDLLCPSEPQLRETYRNFGDGLPAVTWELLEETGTRAAIVSLDAEGIIAFNRLPEDNDSSWQTRLHGEHIPDMTGSPLDALGCDDVLLTTATLALASGGSLLAAAFLGAVASALHGRRVGNVPIEPASLRKELSRVLGARIAFQPSEPDVVAHVRRDPITRNAS
ncbi:MAG: hypothetical protein D6695_02385 [Planctomycetota bacterium]|nr:MAG: hypothetical protein D6695_02385 [Planctomycetota bacterium]